MSHTKLTYNCSQADLYAVCTLGWTNYNNNLAAFTGFKPLYTAAYGTAGLADVVAAQALPDEQTRDEAVESGRIILSQKADVCLNRWQDLKRYILGAYAANFQKPKLEAAGSDYYATAKNENWSVVKTMMVAGEQFIIANLADLTANNNMPANFQTSFTNAKLDFETAYTAFLVAEENAVLQTESKILANNAIKDKLDAMFGDGQAIFRTSPDMADLFTFDYVLGLVSGPGSAGVKGTVSPKAAVIAGVTISIPAQNKSVIADEEGGYIISGIKSGSVILTFEAPGFVTQTITADVGVGVKVTKNVTMVAGISSPPTQ